MATGVGVGIADGRFASAVAARRARALGRWSSRPVARRRSSPRCRSPGCTSSARPTPSSSACSPASAWPASATSPRCPSGDVLARFGPPGRHAHRLAAGLDERPAGGAEPPPERRVEQAFDDPVVPLDPLVFTGKHLADQLVAGLAAEGRVCTRLVVTAETEHGERTERAWYRAAGMSAPAMVERVRWQLDAWMSSGEVSAGVVLLRLAPDEVRGDDGDQVRLWGGPSAADERADARRRPAGRDGGGPGRARAGVAGRAAAGRPLRLGAGIDDRPHRRRRHGRAAAPAPARRPVTAGGAGGVGATVGRPGRGRGRCRRRRRPSCRPTVQPAELLDADRPAGRRQRPGRAQRAAGDAGVAGRPPQAVTGWAGPWPLDERWWEPRRHRRLARFQVVTADGAAHLVLAEHRTWWVAATYG